MKTLPLGLALTCLAGCAAPEAAYPSLQPRVAERIGFDEPPVAAPASAAPDPALDAKLRDAAAKLGAIARGFDADATRATRAAAVAGTRTVGSEGWIAAQTALAALDDWRAQASSLASDLAALAGERAGSVGTPYPTLDDLRARADAEAEREAAAIARLGAALPTP